MSWYAAFAVWPLGWAVGRWHDFFGWWGVLIGVLVGLSLLVVERAVDE